ncbi:hypothetical protein KVR01_000615 [Diaporthe batatas]|uniref:uncharacterized protein n=1 Tax=Diaporthe batatas TaxID=748121 RepID=UPI001D042EE9|nr:uncharacterized protein KVR01_000615 [Diaporthe batatas]KAG8169870.1 hypothetical protein KVR01_000615 [Diaporthe batatas]
MADVNTTQSSHVTTGTRQHESSNPFGKAVKGIAATIGLASETIYHHKQKRASQRSPRDSVPRSFSNDDCISTAGNLDYFRTPDEAEPEQRLPTQVDEVAWALDEVQDDISTNSGTTTPPDHNPPGSPKLAESFLQSHPPTEGTKASGRLELPVVITQRRPKARTRGFIRAYAPVLQNVGIDQETFIEFIDQLNKAVEPSPWISAIDLASLAGHAFPEPIHLLISASALMATQITAEVVSRSKSNAFLDKMNQDFFKPKGLIALVVTWKPNQDGSEQNATSIVDIDMSAAAVKKNSRGDDPAGLKRSRSTIQMPSAGEMFELPEFAPLVFPKLEAATESPEPRAPAAPSHRRSTQDMGTRKGEENEIKERYSLSTRARRKTTGNRELQHRAEPGCLPAFRQSTAEYVGPAVRQVKLGGKSAGTSIRRTGHFISDYQDRRAVARWSGQHPDSQMAKLAPAPGFQSRFADPNHPAASGDFVALVTGGKRTTAEVSREAVRATVAAGREGLSRVKSTTGRAGLGLGGGGEDGGPPRQIISPRAKEAFADIRPRGDWLPRLPNNVTAGVAPRLRRIGSLPVAAPVRTMKKLLQPDIIYLMIVNLPTEEEIADATVCLNQASEET